MTPRALASGDRMRRDHFTLTTANVDEDSGEPGIRLEYDGPADSLTAAMHDEEGNVPDGGDVDVGFRLQEPHDNPDATGVFSLTRRLTGEYLLESNADAADVFGVVDAARERDGRYHVHIARAGDERLTLEKETLLVYDTEGGLLRGQSLIPGGVEL